MLLASSWIIKPDVTMSEVGVIVGVGVFEDVFVGVFVLVGV